MDLRTSDYLHPQGVGATKDDPSDDDSFLDPVKVATDFVKLFPMAKKEGAVTKCNMVEAPPTPGRPLFSFSIGSRKNFPSKWDDAEKWLINGSDSPAHPLHDLVPKTSSNGRVVRPQQQQQQQKHQNTEVSKAISVLQVPNTVSMGPDHNHRNSLNGISPSDSSHVLLKDKFTNGEESNVPRFKCLVPINQGFVFTAMKDASTEVLEEVKRRDTGTSMTPPGTSTPLKSLSPPRHNTPASMSGPLALINPNLSFDIADLQECHLAKLQLETGTCKWSSREEEEEDISKSLRHFEMNNECQKSIQHQPRACDWEEEERTKSHLRYQREEAKIQAWVNLQNAKAEAQSRKLEVKIQKMRCIFEEKMIRKMASVDRRAEELRAAAQHEHNVQIQKTSVRATKKSMSAPGHGGCFPCRCSKQHSSSLT